MFAAVLTALWISAEARADVLPPEPKTNFAKGQAPNPTRIIVAGSSISAAIVLAGLIVSRWPRSKSGALKLVLALGFIVALGGTIFGTVSMYQSLNDKIQADDRARQDYEEQVRNRRRNWRPPPDFDRGPKEPPPGAQSSPSKEAA
jgi:hypothetical protein